TPAPVRGDVLRRVGDLLVKLGRISQEQLNAAVEAQGRNRGKRLGEILVQEGFLAREQLERHIRIQIEEAVYFLFTWAQGTFNFESDIRPEHEEFLVSINPESLLLEGARRVDEWSLIEKKIPTFDLIFTVDQERIAASDVHLTPEQQAIIPLLDGARGVAHVIEDSGLVEFEVGKALYGLVTAGFAHRAGRTSDSHVSEVSDGRLQEHRNLGVAFYRTGMLDEAAREFRRVAEMRPTDGTALFYVGVVELKRARWREAIENLRLARDNTPGKAAVLHNLGLALEQTGQFDAADEAYGEAAAKARYDARILLSWGMTALERKEFQVAEGRLDRAREVAGDQPLPARWYWARALAAVGQDDMETADGLLREGLEKFPKHPVLLNNLAALLDLVGQGDEAEDLLRTALAEEPAIPQLSKNLGDILYRQGRYDESWQAYQRAVKLDADLGDDIWFKIGNIAYKRMDRPAAASAWQQTLAINPAHQLARTNLETLEALK
ncbi:MAG: tetratricopeptide repeat protein, partial [Gemmatimonadales bacterium]